MHKYDVIVVHDVNRSDVFLCAVAWVYFGQQSTFGLSSLIQEWHISSIPSCRVRFDVAFLSPTRSGLNFAAHYQPPGCRNQVQILTSHRPFAQRPLEVCDSETLPPIEEHKKLYSGPGPRSLHGSLYLKSSKRKWRIATLVCAGRRYQLDY